MPFDPASARRETTTTSAASFAAITPSNSTDLDELTKAIYVGGAGNIVAVDWLNNTCTFTAVPAGTVLPIRVRRINSTSTTATALVALY